MSDTTTNDGGPAFPEPFVPSTSGFTLNMHPGMSLRDYFAAAALPGVVSSLKEADLKACKRDADALAIGIARTAYCIAGAMISERSRK